MVSMKVPVMEMRPCSAGSFVLAEGAFDDQHDGVRHGRNMQEDEPQGNDDIEHSHEGNDFRGDLGDALESADGDGGNEDGQQDIRFDFWHTEGDIDTVHNGIDLREGADSEEGNENGRDGEESGQGAVLLAHAVPDVEHGASGNLAFLVNGAILDGQQSFGIFCRHAEESGHPHPENSAGAADFHSCGNSYDIACADGRRKGNAERLETRYIAHSVVLRPEDEPKGLGQAENLQKSQTNGKEDACAHQERDERRPPHERVDGVQCWDE